MAKVSMLYTHVGKRTVGVGDAITYTDKTMLGRGGIKADIKFNKATGSVWEAGVEYDKTAMVSGGTCDYETGVLSDEQIAFILGHQKDAESGEVIFNADDEVPELGMCFIAQLINNGVTSYRGIFLNRVKFQEPDDSYETAKGDINLSTYGLSCDIMLDEDRNYKSSKTFTGATALADAKAWCDAKFTA